MRSTQARVEQKKNKEKKDKYRARDRNREASFRNCVHHLVLFVRSDIPTSPAKVCVSTAEHERARLVSLLCIPL